MPAALEGVRALDLAGPEGHYCGRVLADLGAEVIKVEPPQGDPARHIGPFKNDQPDPEASLYFINFNTNKKSITLDLTTQQGQEVSRDLARTADAVVESFPPGTMEAWGLSYRELQQVNPGLIMTSITGFGQSGPYIGYKAPSIVCSAMCGVMSLCGSPGRPPIAEPNEQPYQLAAIYAAYGLLLALRHRDRYGQGQQVEVSRHDVQASGHHLIVNYSANATVLERQGGRSPVGGGAPYGVYPARDGHCHLVVISPAHWKSFVNWMGNPEALADPMWENRHLRNANMDLIDPLVMEFTRQYNKAELFHDGQSRHITVAPVNRPDEFTRDPHPVARDLFVELEHPVIGKYRIPRSAFLLSETPAKLFRPAPTLGQHNDEVLGARPRRPQASASTLGAKRNPGNANSLPLEGVRILDFTQAIAGPVLTGILAGYGAEVIKVESGTHQQRGRSRPDMDPRIVLQQKATFADVNRNKRCITVNMGTEEGRELVRRLVPHCDVVAENFSPRVMERWGLGYEELKKLRSDVIMARLPGFGTTGPYRDYVGLAAVAMSITGMYHQWSYQDSSEPAGPPVWVPDYLSAAFGAVAIVAALRHRDRTGRGQVIDLGQVDATAAVMGTVYLDYFANGRVHGPLGNRSLAAAPHGCYRCKGDDRWCVITVRTQEEWYAFCRAIGVPRWTEDPRFATLEQRLANVDELDEHVEEWTHDHTPHQVMRILQQAGVPAGAVQDGEDLFFDPHLRHRGFIVPLDDHDTGTIEYPGTIVRLSETPGRVERCHGLGEDNHEVLGTLLGLSPEEVTRLQESGVLT